MKNKTAKKLLDFIEKGPSCYHVIDNIKKILTENGCTELYEYEKWSIKPGGRYFVIRNQSSLIAFAVPENDFTGFMIAAAHSDSPAFKIKAAAENGGEKYVQLNTEGYGGMIYSTWFDRPLSVAGRVAVLHDGIVETRLVNIDKDLLIIPNVAIHMNRQINSGFAYNPAVDLQPLFASGAGQGDFSRIIAEAVGAAEDEIVGMDLMLYNRQKGTVWGKDGEFVSAPRLDDLQCAYALVEGFAAAENPKNIPVCCVFDNEEVGSGTRQGAKSNFLSDVLARINEALGRTETEYKIALSSSFMVSADNAHAVHPNHPEYADKSKGPYMNEGIVIKYNANQKYTTDALSDALFKCVCREAGVPVQVYANRADIAGGSTLGNIALEKVSVSTVDIGLSQLAMHSSYETAGTKDTEYLIKAMKAYFEKTIIPLGYGIYKI